MTRSFEGREIRRADAAEAGGLFREIAGADCCVDPRADHVPDTQPADYPLVGPMAWVAEERARPVGIVSMDAVGQMDLLYVCPEARGTGVAEALLAALDNHALVAGLPHVTVQASQSLRPYLSRRGWTEDRRSWPAADKAGSATISMIRIPGELTRVAENADQTGKRLIHPVGSAVRDVAQG